MFINEVISYNGAWEELNKTHQDLIEEIEKVLQNIECAFIQKNNAKGMSRGDVNFEIFSHIYQKLQKFGFRQQTTSREFAENDKNFLIYKDKILIETLALSTEIVELIYGETFFCVKFHKLSLVILLCRNYSDMDLHEFLGYPNAMFNKDVLGLLDTRAMQNALEEIGTENVIYPLLILGLGFKKENMKIQHIEPQNIKVNRCITFAPEYYQAGLSILNYFGTVLRNKYPEQKATVKIEQHENMVRMIVESENGDKDIIEKALYEYELVMSGQTSVEDFYQEQAQIIGLKQHMRILEVQLENQRDLLRWQDRNHQETQNRILDLQEVIRGLLNQTKAPITINNYLTNQQTVNINHKNELNRSYDLLDELIDAVKDESLKSQLRDLQNAVDQSKNLEQAAQVKDSSGFKKLSKFIKQANDTSSDVHGILDKTDKAIGLIEKLTAHYDKLVQFTSGLL